MIYSPIDIRVRHYKPLGADGMVTETKPPVWKRLLRKMIPTSVFGREMILDTDEPSDPKRRNVILMRPDSIRDYIPGVNIDIQEFFIPLNKIDIFYTRVIEDCYYYGKVMNCSIGIIRAHNNSYFTNIQKDTAVFLITFMRTPTVGGLIRKLISQCHDMGGTFNIYYTGWQTPDQNRKNLINKKMYSIRPEIFDNDIMREMKQFVFRPAMASKPIPISLKRAII
jgi:hypothetical protein